MARIPTVIGQLLQAEKLSACEFAKQSYPDTLIRRPVYLDRAIIAWIEVDILRTTNRPMTHAYVGFVYLTAKGGGVVQLPWSPNI
jgi:hypothetical protein